MQKLNYGPYSPSRLEAGTCGHQFKRSYIDKDPEAKRTSIPAARGSVVHECLEELTRRYLKDRNYKPSASEIRDLVASGVGRYPEAYSVIDDILPIVQKYMERPPKDLPDDADVEQRFAVKWSDEKKDFVECGYDDPDAFARGRADISFISDDLTKAVIYDHKTQANIDEADTFQLGFYAWVFSKIHPYLTEITTILHFARYAWYSEPYTWTKADLLDIEDEIVTRILSIERRQSWDAIPNKNCQYCAFIDTCPIVGEYVERDAEGNLVSKKKDYRTFGDRGQAVKLAGAVSLLKQLKDNMSKELHSYVKANGGVAIPGPVMFEYRAKTEIDWDKVNKLLKSTLAGIFRKHNADPTQFMVYSTTSWKSFNIVQNEALRKEIEAVLPVKKSTTFGDYKS